MLHHSRCNRVRKVVAEARGVCLQHAVRENEKITGNNQLSFTQFQLPLV